MPHRLLRHHPEYAQLLSGAHRKPATIIDTPALVCNVAFWQPSSQEAGRPSFIPFDEWKGHIDRYIAAVFRLLRLRENKPDSPIHDVSCQNTDNVDFSKSQYIFLMSSIIEIATGKLLFSDQIPPHLSKDFIAEYQSIVLRFHWHHTLVKLRFELHHEYLSLTMFIDLSNLPVKNGARISRDEALKDPIYMNIHAELAKIQALLRAGDPDAKKYANIHRFLYDQVWHLLLKEVLVSEPEGGDIESTEAPAKALGEVFADFRGLLLTRPRAAGSAESGIGFQMAGWREEVPQRDFLVPPGLTSNEAAKVLQAIWPFVTSEPRVPFREYELTATRMLGGRAVYITALGAQPSLYSPPREQQLEYIPLFYFLYSHGVRHWQLGRLVDRIHQLGMFRIAAIQELREIRSASVEIRRLAQGIDRAVGNLAAIRSPDELFKEIYGAQTAIADISRRFSGGLSYRIERSRYYVKQFRDGVSGLRIRRIEGFQPYDMFVERRLGATFDFIDRLGRRHERLENHISSLYQYFLAHNGMAINAKIESRNEKIQEIQAAAEVFFLLFPAPYYTIGIANHVLGDDFWEHTFWEQPELTPGNIVSFIIFVIFAVFAWLRYKNFKRKTGSQRDEW